MTQDDPQTMLETAYPKTPQNEPIQVQSPLLNREGYLWFLIERLEQGKNDAKNWPWRQYGTLSAWAKLYADVQGWIPKTPINLTQHVTQTVTQEQVNVAELKRILPSLPEDEQIVLARGIKRIENSAKP